VTLREIRDLGDVHRQARTDDLTGLLNRRAFYEQCDQVLGAQPRTPVTQAPVALMILDLDRFKEINDSLGHAAGDELLVQVAQRLRRTLAADDVLARLGGDEFAVLIPAAGDRDALAVATELGLALGQAFTLDTLSVHVETSIGIACTSVTANTRRELLRCADVAMYQAKTARNGPTVYTAGVADDSALRLSIADDLSRAVAGDSRAGHLIVHLQPQVRLGGAGLASAGLASAGAGGAGDVAGVEALVRWEHPTRGLLQPGAFLAAAQAAGLMGAVTERVLELSLTACRSWWELGHLVPVSVNLSAASVHDQTLPRKVARALARHGLPARALVIELTEDSLMTDPDRAGGVLRQLRILGVCVAIDDYGTGYSSLAYLRHLPVDELKLDRTFTRGLTDDPAATAIVRHTVELAHALGLRLVAEGIEDQTTLELITLLGGDIAQGYHVARPMPIDRLLTWLRCSTAPTAPTAPTGTVGAAGTGRAGRRARL
jgi:diguanylate cyclase (GGDEF)-like protein